jgi:hypothetical protein
MTVAAGQFDILNSTDSGGVGHFVDFSAAGSMPSSISYRLTYSIASSIIWSIGPMSQEDKVKENRLRRIAERRGYRLEKSRRRDPHAPDFGGFMLIEAEKNYVVVGGHPFAYSASLEDVEDWLDSMIGPSTAPAVERDRRAPVAKAAAMFAAIIAGIEESVARSEKMMANIPEGPEKERLRDRFKRMSQRMSQLERRGAKQGLRRA